MVVAAVPVTRKIVNWIRSAARKVLGLMTCCFMPPCHLQHLQRTHGAGGSGTSIREYALHMAADKNTTFAQKIDDFIAYTKKSVETCPQVVMRNIRQFMSSMKNYLVKHGKWEFDMEAECGQSHGNELLNLDAILEVVMHKLVVRPLKEHLYMLFVDKYTENGAMQLLANNIQYARTKPLDDLGIGSKVILPSEESMITISYFLRRLQEVDSPLEKLENLLTCIATLFDSVKACNSGQEEDLSLGADDFLPLFVWVLAQSGMVTAEIEAEFMWGLLHSSLLSGEGGYYLTTLSSAVHVLKNFRKCPEETSAITAFDVSHVTRHLHDECSFDEVNASSSFGESSSLDETSKFDHSVEVWLRQRKLEMAFLSDSDDD